MSYLKLDVLFKTSNFGLSNQFLNNLIKISFNQVYKNIISYPIFQIFNYNHELII